MHTLTIVIQTASQVTHHAPLTAWLFRWTLALQVTILVELSLDNKVKSLPMWRMFGQGCSKSSSGPAFSPVPSPSTQGSQHRVVGTSGGRMPSGDQGLRLHSTSKVPGRSLCFLFCEISALAALTEPSTVQRKLDNAYEGLVKLECVPCK